MSDAELGDRIDDRWEITAKKDRESISWRVSHPDFTRGRRLINLGSATMNAIRALNDAQPRARPTNPRRALEIDVSDDDGDMTCEEAIAVSEAHWSDTCGFHF